MGKRPGIIRELIGRASYSVSVWASMRAQRSDDQTVPDYQFWDRFRRGQARGYKFSSLFAKPITQTLTSFILGEGIVPSVETEGNESNVDYTNSALQKLAASNHGLFITMVNDLRGLGDQYVVVNIDGSFSIPSPETVKIEFDPMDYKRPIKYTIKTVLENVVVLDEYRIDGRTICIEHGGGRKEFQEFPNLIGRIPVIHFKHDAGSNETHGRSDYEPLHRLFLRYDALIEKAIDGAELMGNPIPVFEGMEDPDETIAQNGEPAGEEYQDEEGFIQRQIRIVFDKLTSIVIGKGGRFHFASPSIGFTNDIRNMMKMMFLLILDYTRIPEIVWGGESSGSHATSGEQMKTFYMYVQSQRVFLEGQAYDGLMDARPFDGFINLFDIWLRIKALTDRKIVLGGIKIRWPEVSSVNEEIVMKWVQLAYANGWITSELGLAHSNLTETPAEEIEKARLEQQENDEFARALGDEIDASNAEGRLYDKYLHK